MAEARFRFTDDERAGIVAELKAPQPQVDRVIDLCELEASSYRYHRTYYGEFPAPGQLKERLEKLYNAMEQVYSLATFDYNYSLAERFWSNVYFLQYGDRYDEKLERHYELRNKFKANQHHLFRFMDRRFEDFSKLGYGNQRFNEMHFLKELSCIYFHELGRKPGRSKSTIGPFVRFAHLVMAPALEPIVLEIETLNERWARLRYDPSNMRMVRENFEWMKSFFGGDEEEPADQKLSRP